MGAYQHHDLKNTTERMKTKAVKQVYTFLDISPSLAETKPRVLPVGGHIEKDSECFISGMGLKAGHCLGEEDSHGQDFRTCGR